MPQVLVLYSSEYIGKSESYLTEVQIKTHDFKIAIFEVQLLCEINLEQHNGQDNQ